MKEQELDLALERARLRLALANGRRARDRCWAELEALIAARPTEQSRRVKPDPTQD